MELSVALVEAAAADAARAETARLAAIANLAELGWCRVDLPGDCGPGGYWDGAFGAARLAELRDGLTWEVRLFWDSGDQAFGMVPRWQFAGHTAAVAAAQLEGRVAPGWAG